MTGARRRSCAPRPGGVGGHQQQGAGGGFPQRRARVAPVGVAGECARARLQGRGAWQGDSLHGSTTWRRTAGRVSVGADHNTASFAVETLRSWWRRMRSAVPGGAAAAGDGRRGAARTAAAARYGVSSCSACRRNRAEGVGVPLPAREGQVEQDRAPDVLPEHGELARPTAGEPGGGGGEPDRREDDPQGPEHRFGTHGNEYPIGVKVSDGRMTALSLRRDELHGDWNYILSPNPKTTN